MAMVANVRGMTKNRKKSHDGLVWLLCINNVTKKSYLAICCTQLNLQTKKLQVETKTLHSSKLVHEPILLESSHQEIRFPTG